MTTATIPFRASKPFRLFDEDVQAGDVIDVARLAPDRIENMELAGYGIRVGGEAKPKAEKAVAVKKRAAARRAPGGVRGAAATKKKPDVKSSAAVADTAKKRVSKPSPRKRAGASAKGK